MDTFSAVAHAIVLSRWYVVTCSSVILAQVTGKLQAMQLLVDNNLSIYIRGLKAFLICEHLEIFQA